jgi:hypothetical protein
LEFLSNLPNDKREEELLRLPARKFYWCRLHFSSAVWSECTSSSLSTINTCKIFHAHFNALFYSAHHKIFALVSALQKIQNETYIKVRSVIHEDLKNQLHKKEDSSKTGRYRVNLISRIEFVSSVSYKFLPNTHS